MDHADVADCAVFPMKDDVKGEVPVGLVVVNKGSTIAEEQLRKELILLVRDKLGPVAAFKKVGSVRALPKVRPFHDCRVRRCNNTSTAVMIAKN
jgi:propionyl-CoA synthetase